MARIDSYDPQSVRPVTGTLWVWEPDEPHATELIRVTSVRWNGEEWWVGTMKPSADPSLPPPMRDPEIWNDLSRFWEACHAVAATPGPRGPADRMRTGPARPDELDVTTGDR